MKSFTLISFITISLLALISCGGADTDTSESPGGVIPAPLTLDNQTLTLDGSVTLSFFSDSTVLVYPDPALGFDFRDNTFFETGTVIYSNNGSNKYADYVNQVNDPANRTNIMRYQVVYDPLNTNVTNRMTVNIIGSGFSTSDSLPDGGISNDDLIFGGDYSELGEHLELVFEFSLAEESQTLELDPLTFLRNNDGTTVDLQALFSGPLETLTRIELERRIRTSVIPVDLVGKVMSLSTSNKPAFVSLDTSAPIADAFDNPEILATDDIVALSFPYRNDNQATDDITGEVLDYRQEYLNILQDIFNGNSTIEEYGFNESIRIAFSDERITGAGNSPARRARVERNFSYFTAPVGSPDRQFRQLSLSEDAAWVIYNTIDEEDSQFLSFYSNLSGGNINRRNNVPPNTLVDIESFFNLNSTTVSASGAFSSFPPAFFTIYEFYGFNNPSGSVTINPAPTQ